MISASRLLAQTLGRVAPKYRTLDQWCTTYRQIVACRPLCDKTRANRASALSWYAVIAVEPV